MPHRGRRSGGCYRRPASRPLCSTVPRRYVASPQNRKWLCLIVDVQLTGMSGIELQRQLRAAECDVPVIIISGNRTDSVREHADQAGCAAFLWKPFSGETILVAPRIDRTATPAPDPKCSWTNVQ